MTTPYFTTIFEDAIKTSRAKLYKNGIDEREKQDQFSPDQEKEETSSPAPSKTIEDEKTKLKKGNVTVDDIIEKLNSIRSGKSFKDSTIKKNMEEYVDSLTKSERVAMLAFLKGISQIVTGEIEAQQAERPDEPPSNVNMEKEKQQKVNVKPDIVKKDEKPQTGNKGPLPITPKK